MSKVEYGKEKRID